MIFQSLDFVVFFLIVFSVHWLLRGRLRNLFLLSASYLFYGYVHPWFLFLIIFETLVVYICALKIRASPIHRTAYLWMAISLCLTVLGVFKYSRFFVDSAVSAMNALGVDISDPVFRIALPVGISFMTFQALAYVIDVYRGEIEPRSKLLDVALFKAFFPQLVAGPIERAKHLLPQLEAERVLTSSMIVNGLLLIAWGFFKKLVIADSVSVIANKVFLLQQPGFPILWAGVLAFCVQILADFSAYTDIARGTAKLLGVNLIENFRHPYFSATPVEFWRRWHISLSSWFRDYVYIPLGGSRAGALMEYRNVMVTFLLSGLWHGASWNFVLWGGYHGALIVIYRTLSRFAPAGIALRRVLTPFYVALVFILTNVGWLLFRETDIHYLIRDLMTPISRATPLEWQAARYFVGVIFLYSIPLILHAAFDRMRAQSKQAGEDLRLRNVWGRLALATSLFSAMLVLRTGSSADFIYFRF
jgi:alginate O-acetyltransferase complex protein AlgI